MRVWLYKAISWQHGLPNTHVYQQRSPLFSTASWTQSFAAVTDDLMPSSGCRGEPHCDCCGFSVVPQRWCWGCLLCSAELWDSALLDSSPREQCLEQKISPPRGRKGRPSRGSWQRAQQKHDSTACQCWPSYIIWPWSIPERKLLIFFVHDLLSVCECRWLFIGHQMTLQFHCYCLLLVKLILQAAVW